MTEAKEEETGMFNLTSKFWRTFLIVIDALLIFAGPTYLIYVLWDLLKLSYAVSFGTGFAVLVVGLVLMVYLIRKKIIV